MPTLDLRDRPDDEHRDLIGEALEDAAAGDRLEIVADRDVDAELLAHQIERDRELEWSHEGADSGPRQVRVTVGAPLEGAYGDFDARELVPQRRHEVLLATFEALDPGEGFVLVNDHDPKPLYHELRSTHGDVVGWEYRSEGGGEWRVAIEKTGASEAPDDDDGVITRYDVREIPKEERHPTIHHRYGMLPDGEAMDLIAPHEPRPLRGEFEERYGGDFSWEVLEDEPGRCRVRITKREGGTDGDGDGSVAVTEELDVRDRPPAERHELIFEAYGGLETGEGFVLVNDHDPKPLYHQFRAEAGPEFRWEYRARDPGEFRVLIAKADVDGNAEPARQEPDAPF